MGDFFYLHFFTQNCSIVKHIQSTVHDNHASHVCLAGSRPIYRNHVYLLRLLRNHKRIDIRRMSMQIKNKSQEYASILSALLFYQIYARLKVVAVLLDDCSNTTWTLQYVHPHGFGYTVFLVFNSVLCVIYGLFCMIWYVIFVVVWVFVAKMLLRFLNHYLWLQFLHLPHSWLSK